MILVNKAFCDDGITPILRPDVVTFLPYAMRWDAKHPACEEVVLFVTTPCAPQTQLHWLTCVADLYAYCADAAGEIREELLTAFFAANHLFEVGACRLGLYFCESGPWAAIHRLAADASYLHADYLRLCAEQLPAV